MPLGSRAPALACGSPIASRARFLNKNYLIESHYAASQDKTRVFELNGVRSVTYAVPWVKKPFGCGSPIASRTRFLNKNHLIESHYATSQDKMRIFELNGVRIVTYAVPWVKNPPAVGTAESGPNC